MKKIRHDEAWEEYVYWQNPRPEDIEENQQTFGRYTMTENNKNMLNDDELEKTTGGIYLETGKLPHYRDIASAIASHPEFVSWLKTPKWPCPKCGSWKVENYDPGDLYQIRVYCHDCGWYGCRDGEEDNKFGGEKMKEWINFVDEYRF